MFHIFGLRALQILIETFSLILNAIKKISNVSGVCRVPRVENNQSAGELLIIKSSKIYFTECRLQLCGKQQLIILVMVWILRTGVLIDNNMNAEFHSALSLTEMYQNIIS